MRVDSYRYIVVEGPIGVGKTSLTTKLAARLQAQTLLELAQCLAAGGRLADSNIMQEVESFEARMSKFYGRRCD